MDTLKWAPVPPGLASWNLTSPHCVPMHDEDRMARALEAFHQALRPALELPPCPPSAMGPASGHQRERAGGRARCVTRATTMIR